MCPLGNNAYSIAYVDHHIQHPLLIGQEVVVMLQRRQEAEVTMQLLTFTESREVDIDGLGQDCSISSALAMEILQSCTEPSI